MTIGHSAITIAKDIPPYTRTLYLAGIIRCKVLLLIEIHRVTQILSACKKYRIDLRKSVEVSGIRYYVDSGKGLA